MDFLKIRLGFRSNEPKSSPFLMLYLLSTTVALPFSELTIETQLTTQMGLFPEIQRAYITVDNRLYLWNYLNGYPLFVSNLIRSEDFQSFSDSSQTLLAVRLIPPRPGVFLPSITYLLALCTSSTFFLLG